MLADYTWLADGEGKGCYEKTGIYSVRLNGVNAMVESDSTPGSGHSTVALETAQEPQKGTRLQTSSVKVKMYPEATRVGADLYSIMISWYVHHISTLTRTFQYSKQIKASLWSVSQKCLFKDHVMCKAASSTILLYVKHIIPTLKHTLARVWWSPWHHDIKYTFLLSSGWV